MKVLAVDPGEVNLGIAVSDPTGTIANPLIVLRHSSRPIDAATIAALASEQGAELIVVGQTFDEEGLPTPQARRAARLAASLRSQTELPILLWEESGSTQAARNARIALGVRRSRRAGHLDELAATVILQTYLDSMK